MTILEQSPAARAVEPLPSRRPSTPARPAVDRLEPRVLFAASIQPVIVSGDPIPGAAGEVFVAAGAPVVSPGGQVAFLGGSRPARGRPRLTELVMAGTPGALRVVARQGADAPGAGAAYASGDPRVDDATFDPVRIGPSGHVAFGARLAGVTADDNNHALFLAPAGPGDPQLVARHGAAAPGTATTYIGEFDPAPDAVGGVSFAARIVDPGDPGSFAHAVFAGPPGAVSAVRLDDDLVPVSEAPAVNPAGALAITLLQTGPSGLRSVAYLAGRSGDVQIVAREDDPAPGAGPGLAYGSIGGARINAAGQVAFTADLVAAADGSRASTAGFAGAPGALQPFAREGDPAPGAAAGATFGEILEPPVINAQGNVAVVVEVVPPGGAADAAEQAVYAGPPGALRLVARQGAPAPGTPAGVTFDAFQAADFDAAIQMNAAGRVAFTARLTGRRVTARNNIGIWSTDGDGDLQLVARLGDRIGLGGRRPQPVQFLEFGADDDSGGEDGRATAIDATGRVVFAAAVFKGRQPRGGVFLGSVTPDPRPAAAARAGPAAHAATRAEKAVRSRPWGS